MPVAVDVPLKHFPVVDRRLPRLARVAQHQPALELRHVAAKFLAPLAARFEMNRADSAERRRVMILRARGNANDDGLDVAADVNPVLAVEPRLR